MEQKKEHPISQHADSSSDSESENFTCCEDDEDYWGEEGLGHELEMDFNRIGGCEDPYFGKSNAETESWKKKLGRETRRRLTSGTKAVGGAILTTGETVINNVVLAVKSSINVGESNTSAIHKPEIKTTHSNIADIISKNNETVKTDGKSETSNNQPFEVGYLENHQDSFNGLAGKAKRRIILTAGCSHTCVYIVDDTDE